MIRCKTVDIDSSDLNQVLIDGTQRNSLAVWMAPGSSNLLLAGVEDQPKGERFKLLGNFTAGPFVLREGSVLYGVRSGSSATERVIVYTTDL